MPPLPDAVRRLCSGLALASLVSGIATLPLSVRSAANTSIAVRNAAHIGTANALPAAVPIHRNPFQGDPAPLESPPRPFPSGVFARTNGILLPGLGMPTVSAIALGAHPSALFEENGVSRIRAIGDRVGRHAIVAISLDGVRLDDGTLLVMTGGMESPSPARADAFPAIPIGVQPLPDVRGDTR